MAARRGRFDCNLYRHEDPECHELARVTIVDSTGARVRGCPKHAMAALDGTTGSHVDWDDSKGLNEYERAALELTEERGRLGR